MVKKSRIPEGQCHYLNDIGRKPILFSLILLAFAAAALWLRKEQSGMIAAVLLVIGLGLPILYIGTFISQLNLQAERFKLGKGRKVYTVTLENDGLTITSSRRKRTCIFPGMMCGGHTGGRAAFICTPPRQRPSFCPPVRQTHRIM